MTQQEQRLQAFFVRYGEALAAGDLQTIANCYAVPGLVLSDVTCYLKTGPATMRVRAPQ